MTHQGDVKEVGAMKADGVVISRQLCLRQKAAFEQRKDYIQLQTSICVLRLRVRK